MNQPEAINPMRDGCDDVRERDRMMTWIDTQWQIIGASPAVLRVMACGPSAVAGLMTKMLFEMGAPLEQVKTAAKAMLEVEIPAEKLYLVNTFNSRANKAPLMTDSGVADAIADIITDITALDMRLKQFEREIRKPATIGVGGA